MIMDQITDWIVTAWELIGLVFLAFTPGPTVVGPPKRSPEDERTPVPPAPRSARRHRRLAQPQFA
jgi:hypothetical protein